MWYIVRYILSVRGEFSIDAKDVMILMKKVTSKQVLEIMADLVKEDLPEDFEGDLHLRYDDDDNIEIFLMEKKDIAIA